MWAVGDTTDGGLGLRPGRQSTWHDLEQAIGALGGGHALTFSSGMAAAHAVLEGFRPGHSGGSYPDHCYLGLSLPLSRSARPGYRWSVRRVDVADTAAVLAAADGADLVWLESPTNPMIEIADLPRLGAELQDGVTLVVDNTFATPLLQQPLSSGAAAVVHSATKIMSGHSDVLLGAVVSRSRRRASTRSSGYEVSFGAIPGPMEAYLALRGLRTCRSTGQAQASAQVLAERLAEHPRVRRVRFPGLPDDPGHARARQTMAGFGSLLSVSSMMPTRPRRW